MKANSRACSLAFIGTAQRPACQIAYITSIDSTQLDMAKATRSPRAEAEAAGEMHAHHRDLAPQVAIGEIGRRPAGERRQVAEFLGRSQQQMGDVHGEYPRRLLQAGDDLAMCRLMQDFDFAIIGAGIAGVSAAYHLAPPRPGDRARARARRRPITRPAARRRCIRRPTAARRSAPSPWRRAASIASRPGLRRSIPCSRRAALIAGRAEPAGGDAEGGRRLCPPGAERALARSRPRRCAASRC